MGFKSKRYKKAAENATKEVLSLKAAVEKVKSFGTTKFDQTVELVMHLGIDPKQADQMIRGSISLPHGIGKQKKVIAFCEDSDAEAAKAAGAIEAGCDDLIAKVADGWMDFDVAIASPKVMGKAGKLGRVLGPQGKMPSPKNGTVTMEVVKAVGEFAAGKVEFRNDAGGNIHAVVGKLSFESKKLLENLDTFITLIKRMHPDSTKGEYIKKISISATMSPGIEIHVD
jgi:large subunit ribosomal protein L1